MANKNKSAADVVLEVSIDQYNKEKSTLSTRSRGMVVEKENFTLEDDIVETIENKVNELAEANSLDISSIPVVVDGTGSSAALRDSLKDKGLDIVQRSKGKKDKNYGYTDSGYDYYYSPLTPYNSINFDDLEQALVAQELNHDYMILFEQYREMGQRIIDGNYHLEFGDERGKLSLMTELTQQFLNRLETKTTEKGMSIRKEYNKNPATEAEAVEVVKDIIEDAVETAIAEHEADDMVKEADSELVVKSKGVMLFKNAQGELIWAGIHSNKFEDRDKDILKDVSHRRFVQKVYDGDYAFPELWIWHIDKAVGETNWLAYDERGFLLSGGKVKKEFEELVTTLVENTPEMGMSHGMPYESVKYDDDGFIKEYQSIEITMLPVSEASNVLTSFTVEKK